MRIQTWYGALGIVGTALIATAVGCSSSSPDTTTTTPEEDAASDATADTSTTPPADDSGTDSGTPATDASDAATCSANAPSDNATCNACLATTCCDALSTCFGVADAASPLCATLLGCIQDAEAGNADAGVAAMSMDDAVTSCTGGDAGTTYAASDIAAAEALLVCEGDFTSDAGAANCSTACSQ